MRSILFLTLLLAPLVSQAEDWPHWRGPLRNDISTESSGYRDGKWFSSDPLWKRKVGEGSSSCIVANGSLFVCGWKDGKEQVVCLDAKSGAIRWTQSYAAPRFGRHAVGDQRMYSGPSGTPEYDPATGGLYTLGTDGELRCWATAKQGQLVWRLNLYEIFGAPQRPDVGKRTLRDYGYTTAPLVQGNTVIVEVGAKSGALMGFDKRTGKRVWASQATDEAGHTGGLAPITVEGVPCVAVLTLRNLLVVRIDEEHAGETVATYPWTTDYANNIASPVVQGNDVLVTSSYNHGQMAKVRITLQGAEEIWRADVASGVCTPVVHQGHIYWAWRGVHCVDFESGKEAWSGGRVGSPGSCIVTSDDRLIVWSNNGELSLVDTAQHSPKKYHELAAFKAGFRTDAWPHVTLANGRLYCKSRDGDIHCYGN